MIYNTLTAWKTHPIKVKACIIKRTSKALHHKAGTGLIVLVHCQG